MTNYQINFAYSVPEWSDITIEAASSKEAQDKAMEVIQDLYPEAIDIEVTDVIDVEVKDAS